MLRWTSSLLLLLLCDTILAQSDSLRLLNTYRSQMLSIGGPVLNADNGRHILSVQYSQSLNAVSDEHDNSYLVGYGTQWRKHGFGIRIKQDVDMDNLHTKTDYGLQYAYAFDFKKWGNFKRTRVILGVGANYVQEKRYLNKTRWFDQIDDLWGFTNGTSEQTSESDISYWSLDYQAIIRSPKVFISMIVSGLPRPQNNVYPVSEFEKPIYNVPAIYQWNSGLKISDIGAFTPWFLFDAKHQKQIRHYQAGIALAYKNKWTIQYQICMNRNDFYHRIGANYYTPRIRAFAYYQNVPNPYFGYLDMGMLQAGLAFGITKQPTP